MYGNLFSNVNFGVGVVREAVIVRVLRFLRTKACFGWEVLEKALRLLVIGYADFELAGRIICLKI